MLKLLIADDERIIRETIFNIIDWKKHDIEVIGLCKNGIEAYDMILVSHRILYLRISVCQVWEAWN